MKEFCSLALRYLGGKLEVLDQCELPHKEIWIQVDHPTKMEQLIKQLSIRGAPLIGIGAAVSLAHFAEKGANQAQIKEAGLLLREARPTAVNLSYAVDTVLNEVDDVDALVKVTDNMIDTERQCSKAIALAGAELINDGDGIITHCNTGGLVTIGNGTALAVIRQAFEKGKKIHVYVDETRPLLQGARLTCWELQRLGIPFTLICDSMSAVVMSQGKVQRAFVGADRIALNGDFANKIGTYNLAILAHYHNIPFHPVAPLSTVDFSCPTGKNIVIEERTADEVRGAKGSFGQVCWSPIDTPVFNPSFDVTPVRLIRSLILDTGVYSESQLACGALQQRTILCGQ